VYKKRLFELDLQTLKNIHQQLNTTSNSPSIQAVLSYTPSESEKFLVKEFKTGLQEYLWNHHVQMNPSFFESKGIPPMAIIDSQNNVRYINTSHIAKILQQENKAPKQNGGRRPNNNNNESNLFSSSSSSSSPSNINFSIKPSSSSSRKNRNEHENMNVKKNQNGNDGNRNNGNRNNGNRNNGNGNHNLNELKRKIQQANRNFGLKEQREDGKEPSNNTNHKGLPNHINNNGLKQFLEELPGKLEQPIPKGQNQNEGKRNEAPISFQLQNYEKPTLFCTSNKEECSLTKTELCKAITEHFIVRGNIIASILSNIPYKTNRGFEGGYCYQRFLNLDKCQVCLPHNYQELMSMDPNTRIQTMMIFINYMTEKECVENKGLFRKLSIAEKKSLLQHARNGDEFNILYTEYTQNVRQKYIEHLQILLEILNTLSSMESINN
jgi:hypothetical protein